MSTEATSHAGTTERPATKRRILRALVLAGAVGLLALPLSVWAADSFTDVPNTNVHHDAITSVRDAGVTQGCTPTEYCPGDNVRRDQMASFLDRLGGLSGQDPVVNAATVQGLGPDDLQGATGPQGPAGPEGPAGPQGPQGDPAVFNRTIITYNTGDTIIPPTTFEKLYDLGTFDKEFADTTVRLRLSSHGRRSGGGSCSWQLRIDDVNRLGGTGFEGSEANHLGTDATTMIETYFDGLGTGAHTVSLWARGVGSPTCHDNPGNFTTSLVVEEVAAG